MFSVLGSPPQCLNVTGYNFHRNCWSPGERITLQAAPALLEVGQRAAVTDWNQYLSEDASTPRFEIAGDPGTGIVQVEVTDGGNSTSGFYCGNFSETLDSVAIKPWNPGQSGP